MVVVIIIRSNTYMKDVADLSTMTNVLHYLMTNFYKKMDQFLSATKIVKNLLLRCSKSKSL